MLFVEPRVGIPVSLSMSILVFGLTMYYNTPQISSSYPMVTDSNSIDSNDDDINHSKLENQKNRISTQLFTTFYITFILISLLSHNQSYHVFINWNQIDILGIVSLGSAIMLCFFLPGYAIVLILTKKYMINSVLAIIMSYLLSILITGLTSYISALSFDRAVLDSKYLFIAVYVSILGFFLIRYSQYNISFLTNHHYRLDNIVNKFYYNIKRISSELIVFGGLFMLIIVSTYLLYGVTTIGDQWYHQGRALQFMSGSIREATLSGAEAFYPPFQSSLLAALAVLSGIPLTNAYASIAFLNAIPMFAFYYFYLTWVPVSMKKSSLIASSLFILSAGFGWFYLLNASINHMITSEQSALNIIGKFADLDIISATNFVIPTAPDFSTALIYISLPAGFILLAMVKTTIRSKFANVVMVTSVSLLGIISHYEFYIFIIIASVLPVIFRLKTKSYLYVSLLIATLFVYLIDISAPGNFYSYLDINGISLLLLTGIFITISWIAYLSTNYFNKINFPKLVFQKLRILSRPDSKFKFLIATVVVFLAAYLYLLSYIIIGELPLDIIRAHTYESSVPWYLYPMRLGVAGLLGLAFILSFLFKKFEKQVFVFGVIIILSFVTGPYYDEARFSKYVMMGFIGFASLLIFKFLTWKNHVNAVRNSAIISTVIICSSLSILIFIGYNSLILQTQDFNDILTRRNFPSMSELHLFDALHGIVDTNSEKYNVVSFPDQYDRKKNGVMPKIQAFAGLPNDKLLQSPLTLNASTLDSLYRQLDYSNAQYILLPRNSIQFENSISDPTRFAMDNFRHLYEDGNYTILEVPPIQPPTSSPEAQVALTYNQQNDLLSPQDNDTKLLEYNNNTFNFGIKNQFVVLHRDSKPQSIVLFGTNSQNGTTLWARGFYPHITANSFEVSFRTISDNDNTGNEYVGLKWQKDGNDYFAKLLDNGLEVYQKSINNKRYKILSNNSEIELHKSILYTVKIESLENSINIYVNDLLKNRIPINHSSTDNRGISRIGLTSYHNSAEFMPIKLSDITESSQEDYEKIKYYEYYYPLSILALSKSSYDVFAQNDFSVFSKNTLIVPDSLNMSDSATKKYLAYVRSGGTVIAINSNNDFNGTFSSLFSIQAKENKLVSFTNIASNNSQNFSIDIRGKANRLGIEPTAGEKVTSTYQNISRETIAPFTIEKMLSKGKIILVNAEPLFSSISQYPKEYFHSLSNISQVLPLDNAVVTSSKLTALPMQGIVGYMTTSGNIILNSTSLSIPDDERYPYLLDAERITIINKTGDTPMSYDNVLIKNLKMTGNYNVSININGTLKLPGIGSNHDYIGFIIPNNFNMTAYFHPGILNGIEIVSGNQNLSNFLKLNGDSKVEFYGLKSSPYVEFVPVLLKNPQLIANGHTSIRNANFDGYLLGSGRLDEGEKLGIDGTFRVKFYFVDHYDMLKRGATSTKYVAYLEGDTIDREAYFKHERLKLPADIPLPAIKEGKGLPLMKILTSSANLFTLIALIAVAIFAIFFIRLKTHRTVKGN